jgi:hypothetical protein
MVLWRIKERARGQAPARGRVNPHMTKNKGRTPMKGASAHIITIKWVFKLLFGFLL